MKVTYRHPAMSDGEEIAIPGLNAVLKVNEAVDVDQEVIDEYEARTGESFDEVMKGPNFTGKFPDLEKLAEEQAAEVEQAEAPATEVTESKEK